ncbi:MAG TPA: CsbD family protein [Gemmatimonadales bacterium]|nr:CsbD family protein [Gemmatimonadales bacterium]
MNWDRMAGSWTEMRGRIREWWGRQTHNDTTVINGRKDQLIGRMQQRFGAAVEEIEQQIGSFEREVAGQRQQQ